MAATWLVLGTLRTDEIPWWAAHWLADGADSPALRELAGLNARDTDLVPDLLRTVLADLTVPVPTSLEPPATPR